MSHTKHRASRSKLASLFVWHRYIGVAAAMFVIVLSVTGIMLNHTETLQLDSRHVSDSQLLNWYGINAPNATSFQANTHWATQLGEQLYFDNRKLKTKASKLVGMVPFRDYFVIALDDALLLITDNGDLIEKLDSAAGVPANILQLGTSAGKIAVQTSLSIHSTNPDLLDWNEHDTLEANWSLPTPLPINLKQTLMQHYRGNGLPLERVILDIHSGRIMGDIGVLIVDAATVLFLFLAISGVWLWVKRTRNTRKHRLARQNKK